MVRMTFVIVSQLIAHNSQLITHHSKGVWKTRSPKGE